MSQFVHLHLHTDYSMLDGACDVEKLCYRAKELGMPAVAMTDHGNIFGAVHFVNAAKAAGIKPIIGCELYVCKKDDHRIARTPPDGDTYNHLLVLAETDEGYRNLVKITSEASLHGFYYKPRVSKQFLAEHSKGLIALSGCLKGEIPELLIEEKYGAAREVAATYSDIFGKQNFFFEIQDQGLELEHRIHSNLFKLEKDMGLPLVATNDSHYLCEDDAHAQDVMVCIQTGKSIQDPNRMKFQGSDFYVKSHDEMYQVFKSAPSVLSRTLEIAERCNVQLTKVSNPFPHFDVPDGYTLDSYFEHVSREGFAKRLENIRTLSAAGKLKHGIAEYEQRLAREIGIIQQMRFSGYFLIVWDFVRYAREHKIPVGPGRGSAAGSLVSYSLGITDLDPLQYELFFERFLNPERVSMPDIDMDFCMNRRGQVIDYVTQKYGRENVAQIITFGTMAAKAAIKDVGRAMDIPYADVDRIAKMVPTTINIKLETALKESPALQQAYQSDTQIRQLIDTAKKLEGLVRNAGMHAAGVVISPRPLNELVPLYKTKNDEIVTAFDMVAIEKMGLLKMDFLGLTTLTILDDALKLIRQTRNEQIELDAIPLHDPTTYEKVFHSGLTSGVFQFESHGMRDVLRRYKPSSIEDLTALNALYRPGPIQGGMIDDFIDRKHGRKKIEYELPELEEILEETLGVIVYQEQVMQIANRLAGYSLGEADLLRRAMGKKKAEEMAQQRERFIEGAVQRGYPPKKIEKIFDLMAQFAGYGFNKSHSAAYALLAYHTAYLKTHYPVEFMAALLTSVTGNTDDVVKYINECREMQIAVEPPDIHVSDANFTPHGEAIRFGLAAVKNVGHNAIESIVAARRELAGDGPFDSGSGQVRATQAGRFKSIYEFCEKVDLRLLNKRVLESLIKSGAMDSLGRRAQLMAVLDKAMDHAQKAQRDAESGQHGLFGVFQQDDSHAPEDRLPETPDWDEHVRLANEKEILGFFITGHPLDKFRDKLQDLGALSTAELSAMKSSTGKDESLSTAGIITNLRVLKSKKGDFYAQAALEDLSGSIEMLVFPDAYRKLQDKVKMEVPVLIRGGVRIEEGANPKLTVSDILSLEDVKVPLPRSLRIRIPLENASESTVDELHLLCSQRRGEAKVLFDVERESDFMVVMEAEGYNVLPDRMFVSRVEELCGRGAVRVIN